MFVAKNLAALALAAALVLHQSFPGVRIARVWVLLTWIVPTVVVVIITILAAVVACTWALLSMSLLLFRRKLVLMRMLMHLMYR